VTLPHLKVAGRYRTWQSWVLQIAIVNSVGINTQCDSLPDITAHRGITKLSGVKASPKTNNTHPGCLFLPKNRYQKYGHPVVKIGIQCKQ